MQNVKDMLENWGRSSSDKCLPSGYRCGIAVIIAQNVGGVVGIAPANEDDAASVERVMVLLKQRKPDHYAALHAYYVLRKSIRQIANGSPWSDRAVFDMIKAGEAWVEGAMASSIFIA